MNKQNNYESECPLTDYGTQEVNTNFWNLCEGRKCDEAYVNYKKNNPNDERSLDEMF